jgi:hypothetical protein
VYERLMEHPYVDTTDVEVSVSHGEVTLEGTVPDRWEKRLAEDLAEGVLGVTEVHILLRLLPAPAQVRSARTCRSRKAQPASSVSNVWTAPTGTGLHA